MSEPISNLSADAEPFFPSEPEINEPLSQTELNQNSVVYNTIMGNIDKIENSLSEINGHLEELTGKRQSLFTQAKKLQEDVQEKMTQIEDLQSQMSSKNNEMQSVILQKDELSAEVTRLNQVSGDSGVKVEELAQQLKDKELALNQMEQEKSQIVDKREQLEKATQVDFDNLSTLSQRIIDINKSIEKNNYKLKSILSESWNLEKETGPKPPSGPFDKPQGPSRRPRTRSRISGLEVPVPEGKEEEPLINEEVKNVLSESQNVRPAPLDLDFSDNESDDDFSTPQSLPPSKKSYLDALKKDGGGKRRLPLMYGGTKVPVWRRKKNASAIFRKYKRSEMNRMATKWGVVSPMKYKRKKDLAVAMKLLMHYRYGDIKLKKDISRVARIVGLRPSHYKTKASLKRAVNKRMGNMKMKAGSYFAAELKAGLLNSVKTPLLKGGQGKFLTMRKSSYLKGGQGKFLMKAGGMDLIMEYQNKRAKLEKELKNVKRARNRDPILKKIEVLNKRIAKLMKAGCGCTAGKKYKATRGGNKGIKQIRDMEKKIQKLESELANARAHKRDAIEKKLKGAHNMLRKLKEKVGGAPLDYKMTMGHHHDHPRMGNHSGGSFGGLDKMVKKMLSKPAVGAAVGAAAGVALVGGKKKRKSRRKSSKKKRRSKRKSSKKKRSRRKR